MDKERKESIENLAESIQVEKVENLIKNGSVEVVVEGDTTKYSLRSATLLELNKLTKFKDELFTELIQNEKILCIKQIIKHLKKREMITEEEVKEFERNRERYQATMTDFAKVNSKDKEVIKDYAEQVKAIIEKMRTYLNKVKSYITNSLEVLLKTEVEGCLCSICGEKLVDGKWVKVWNSHDEFKADDKRALIFFMKLSETQADAMDFISGGWQSPQSGE